MNFEIEKTSHTKTGKDLWVAKFERIEDREEYKVFSLLVRKIGGYWSRFTNGFNFSFDPTDVITKEFGDKNFKKSRSTKVSQPNTYAIKKGKIATNCGGLTASVVMSWISGSEPAVCFMLIGTIAAENPRIIPMMPSKLNFSPMNLGPKKPIVPNKIATPPPITTFGNTEKNAVPKSHQPALYPGP